MSQTTISFIKPLDQDLKSTNGRTNILLLSTDYVKGENDEDSSDTMMVVSVDLKAKDKAAVMISIPRDLWVQLPGWKFGNDQNFYSQWSKINAANAYGDIYSYPDGAGLGLARQVVENTLGITIHYVVRVNYFGFKQAVDTLGGVSVNVDNSFTDCEYPVEGQEDNPNVSKRYMCISFKKGPQFMNDETALEFARSRKSLDNGEGSDLARAKRQQKLVAAIRDKALTIQTLADPAKIKSLIDEAGSNLTTLGVDFNQIGAFYRLAQQVDISSAQNIVLSDDPASSAYLLTVPDSGKYGGAFVFIPRAGDGNFNQIQAYVAGVLSSASNKEAASSAQPQSH